MIVFISLYTVLKSKFKNVISINKYSKIIEAAIKYHNEIFRNKFFTEGVLNFI